MSAGAARAREATEALIARLLALHPKRIDLSLGRMERLLAALGHPERKLPPVIHVAGTNGKGSTIAFLRAMLEAAGHGVHVYTSPHLVRFNERFRLAHRGTGRLVGDEALADALMECERANAGDPITLFEITTAAAFLLFSRHPADVLLLEVGLGGRLDATNVIERPLASLIMPVSIDHTEFLGATLERDRRREGGHPEAGSSGDPGPAGAAKPLSTIEREAKRAGRPLFVSGEHWQAYEERGRLVYSDEAGLLDLPRPRLVGAHQIENAGAAIAALRAANAFARADRRLRSRHDPRRLAGAHAAPGPWPARCAASRRRGAVARRRPQCRRRRRGRRRARRARGKSPAPARAGRGHACDQGRRRLPRLLLRSRAPRVRGAGPGRDRAHAGAGGGLGRAAQA